MQFENVIWIENNLGGNFVDILQAGIRKKFDLMRWDGMGNGSRVDSIKQEMELEIERIMWNSYKSKIHKKSEILYRIYDFSESNVPLIWHTRINKQNVIFVINKFINHLYTTKEREILN